MAIENLRIEYGDSNGVIRLDPIEGKALRVHELYIDPQALTEGSYMDISIGTIGITRLPLKTQNYAFIQKYSGSPEKVSIFGFLRYLFGEDVWVEGEEGEPIIFKVYHGDGSPVNLENISVVLYEEIPPGVDRSKLLRSMSPDHIIAPYISKTITIDPGGSIDSFLDLDTVNQLEGLPMIRSGYIVPSGLNFVGKALVVDARIDNGVNAPLSLTDLSIHLKDRTFVFFTPRTLKGIILYRNTSIPANSIAPEPSMNIAGFSLANKTFLPLYDYTFLPGHEIILKAHVTASVGGSSGSATIKTIMVPWLLMKSVR